MDLGGEEGGEMVVSLLLAVIGGSGRLGTCTLRTPPRAAASLSILNCIPIASVNSADIDIIIIVTWTGLYSSLQIGKRPTQRERY